MTHVEIVVPRGDNATHMMPRTTPLTVASLLADELPELLVQRRDELDLPVCGPANDIQVEVRHYGIVKNPADLWVQVFFDGDGPFDTQEQHRLNYAVLDLIADWFDADGVQVPLPDKVRVTAQWASSTRFATARGRLSDRASRRQ